MLKRLRQARADVATMRRLYPAAEQLARDAGHAEPGADDLLLAALDLPDGVARAALATCDVDARALRTAAADLRAAATTDEPTTDPFRSEPSMQMAFHRAVGIAKADRSHVRSGDILLATIATAQDTVTRALDALGVDPAVVRRAVGDHTPG